MTKVTAIPAMSWLFWAREKKQSLVRIFFWGPGPRATLQSVIFPEITLYIFCMSFVHLQTPQASSALSLPILRQARWQWNLPLKLSFLDILVLEYFTFMWAPRGKWIFLWVLSCNFGMLLWPEQHDTMVLKFAYLDLDYWAHPLIHASS